MKPPANASRPAKSVLDPTFRYRPSHATDLRETFARVRRDIERAKETRTLGVKVVPIVRKEQQ